MATNQADGTVALVDLRDHELIDTPLPARSGPEADALAFFPDGRRLAVGGVDGLVNLWDLRTRTVERTLRYDDSVYWAAVSPDGELLAVETQAEDSPASRVEVRDLTAGKTLYSRRRAARPRQPLLQPGRRAARRRGLLSERLDRGGLGCPLGGKGVQPARRRPREFGLLLTGRVCSPSAPTTARSCSWTPRTGRPPDR